MDPKNHFHITALALVEKDGVVIGLDGEHFTRSQESPLVPAGMPRFLPFPAFTRESVGADVFNLLRAAPVMYEGLTQAATVAAAMLSVCDNEAVPEGHPFRELMTQLQNLCMNAQLAARDGVETVADKMKKGQ